MKKPLALAIQKAIQARVLPGCVVGVIAPGKNCRECFAFGKFTYDKNSPVVSGDTIYDVASITKAVPTASLALKAAELGRVSLDDAVINWIPELNNNCSKEIRVKHLLTQTLELDVRLSACKELPPGKILEAIYTAQCKSAPGERFNYCNSTSVLLGILTERVLGKRLDALADEILFRPLEMTHTTFSPSKDEQRLIPPTELDFWRGRTIQGEVHDESAWALRTIMTAGSAGLFSCAPDLLVFIEMIFNGGLYKSQRCFNPSTIQELAKNQITQTGECAGLGWELNQRRFMGECCSNRTIGKTGFTGCMLIADLEKEIGIVLLANHTWPRRKNDKEIINTLRREIADIVFRAL